MPARKLEMVFCSLAVAGGVLFLGLSAAGRVLSPPAQAPAVFAGTATPLAVKWRDGLSTCANCGCAVDKSAGHCGGCGRELVWSTARCDQCGGAGKIRCPHCMGGTPAAAHRRGAACQEACPCCGGNACVRCPSCGGDGILGN